MAETEACLYCPNPLPDDPEVFLCASCAEGGVLIVAEHLMVPTAFVAALLHDSTCPWEPFYKDECGDPLHGASFTPERDRLLAEIKGTRARRPG